MTALNCSCLVLLFAGTDRMPVDFSLQSQCTVSVIVHGVMAHVCY
jgi:hypothetical protein